MQHVDNKGLRPPKDFGLHMGHGVLYHALYPKSGVLWSFRSHGLMPLCVNMPSRVGLMVWDSTIWVALGGREPQH